MTTFIRVSIFSNTQFENFNDFNFYNGKKAVFMPVEKGNYKPNELNGETPVRIVKRNINGKEYIHAEPDKPGSWAMGGNFIFCSDSRINDVNNYPIPLHDRDMSKERR